MISVLFSLVSRSRLVLFLVICTYFVGGGRSTGFALIYDSIDFVKQFEAKYRLNRVQLITWFHFSSEFRSTPDRAERC